MELKKLITDISGLMSVTGFTGRSAAALEDTVGKVFDEHYTDPVGNHVYIRRCGRPNAPKILIDTHFDEIGMMVTEIKDGGFVSVTNIGGLDMRIMQAAEVVIYGEGKDIYGVITSTPPHLTKPTEVRKLKEIDALYIDTGYSKEELEKYVHIGTPVGFRPIYRELMNNCITGKSFDCKSCSACAVYAIAQAKKEELAGDVYMVFSTFEETGTYFGGASVAGYGIDPDYALVADVTGAVIPGDTSKEPKMGEGASITYAPLTSRKMTKMLSEMAKEKGIKLQREVASRATGTNTTVLNLVRGGIPLIDLGLPLKNMHTYNEMISLDDAQSMSDLIKLFICSEEIAKEFTR